MRDGEERSRKLAKYLRRHLTRAEVVLWSRLRRHPLYKFRRQHPIGPYVADFVCIEARLVIEVDGDTHGTDAQVKHDRVREAYLKKRGWRILRVLNDDVYKRLLDVLDLIVTIAASP